MASSFRNNRDSSETMKTIDMKRALPTHQQHWNLSVEKFEPISMMSFRHSEFGDEFPAERYQML